MPVCQPGMPFSFKLESSYVVNQQTACLKSDQLLAFVIQTKGCYNPQTLLYYTLNVSTLESVKLSPIHRAWRNYLVVISLSVS